MAEVLERSQKDKLPALRDIQKEKLLKRKLLRLKKFCVNLKHNIIMTNELIYAGAVVVASMLGVKIDKTAERKEAMWRSSL